MAIPQVGFLKLLPSPLRERMPVTAPGTGWPCTNRSKLATSEGVKDMGEHFYENIFAFYSPVGLTRGPNLGKRFFLYQLGTEKVILISYVSQFTSDAMLRDEGQKRFLSSGPTAG
ncbi:MAG: hypothetical protein ACO3ZD_00730 [Cyanobium sp.]